MASPWSPVHVCIRSSTLQIYVAQPQTQIIDFFELHNIRSESFPSLDPSLLPFFNIENLFLIKSKTIQDFSQQDWNILDVRTSSVLTCDNPFSRDSRDTIQGIQQKGYKEREFWVTICFLSHILCILRTRPINWICLLSLNALPEASERALNLFVCVVVTGADLFRYWGTRGEPWAN